MPKTDNYQVPLGVFQYVLDISKQHAYKMLSGRAADTRNIRQVEDEIITFFTMLKQKHQKVKIIKQKPPRTKKQIEVNADQVQFLATK